MKKIDKYINEIKKYGLKAIIRTKLPRKIHYVLNPYVELMWKTIYKNAKLTNSVVIESHNDFDSNGGAFYNWLIKNGYNTKYKIIWLLRNKAPNGLPNNIITIQLSKPSIKKWYYLCTSKYLISCHVPIGNMHNGQISIYMDHGAISLKSVKGIYHIPHNVNYIFMPSEYMKPILMEDYSIDERYTKPLILGYPYQDILYSDEPGDLRKLTSIKFKKVILWMPTFRKNADGVRNDSTVDEKLGVPILFSYDQYLDLNNYLNKNNTLLIIKIHPMQDLSVVKVKTLSNIIVLDGKSIKKLGLDNYRLMKDTDALISDYSSVAFDYLHLNKPIGYTMDDAKEYKLGFIVNPPEKLMAGIIINNYEDFINFIDDVINDKDQYKEDRKQLFDKSFKYHDGNSCKRLADFLNL